MNRYFIASIFAAVLAVSAGTAAFAQPSDTAPGIVSATPTPAPMRYAEPLAKAATDVTAPMAETQIQSVYVPSFYGAKGAQTSTAWTRLVLPFKNSLLRVSAPLTTMNRVDGGMGDVQLLGLFGHNIAKGRSDIGFVSILPTARDKALGAGKWQVGPAIAVVTSPNRRTQIGFLAQNPISVAGSKLRADQSQLQIQPIFNWFQNGWCIRSSESMWAFDWTHHSALIPVSLGVATIKKVAGTPTSIALSYEVVAVRANLPKTPRNTIRLTMTMLDPQNLIVRP